MKRRNPSCKDSPPSCYAMVQQLGGDAEPAGVEVVVSTMFSVVMLLFWIFLLKNLGLL